MGFLTHVFAVGLALVLILQITIIYLKLIEPSIESMPAGHSNISLSRRQPETNLIEPSIESMPVGHSNISLSRRQTDTNFYTYRGHACSIVPKVDPIPAPGIYHCEPTPTQKLRDAHKKRVRLIALNFCNVYFRPDLFVAQDTVLMPIQATLYAEWYFVDNPPYWDAVYLFKKGQKPRDDVYYVKIDWIEGCPIDWAAPAMTINECVGHVRSAWENCDNHGRGGTLELGCLTYTMITQF